MKKLLRYTVISSIFAAVIISIYWLCCINQPRGCPPELLRVFQDEDIRLIGRPLVMQETGLHYDNARISTTTKTITYTPKDEISELECHYILGANTLTRTATYSYNRQGWLVKSQQVASDEPSINDNYRYIPSERRIEIEHRWKTTGVAAPGAYGGTPATARSAKWNVFSRIKDFFRRTDYVERSIIRLDHRNRYIDIVIYLDKRKFSRSVFKYDRSGRVYRWIRDYGSVVYKRDARGNVTEKKYIDNRGKLAKDTGVTFSAYKYDSVGNWIERRDTVFWPNRTKNKWTLSSITTRKITYRR